MSYLSKVVRPDETVLQTGRLHWIIYAPGMTLAVIGLIIAIGADADAGSLLGGLCFVLGLLSLFVAWMRQWTTEIVVTNRRVLLKRGLIARHTFEMNMTRVESVDVRQGILGRILDYGTIVVRGTGSSTEPLTQIAAPLDIRNAITVQ